MPIMNDTTKESIIKARLEELKEIIDTQGDSNKVAIKEYNALVDILIGQKSRWKYLWKDAEWADWKSKHQSKVMKDLWDTVWAYKRKPEEVPDLSFSTREFKPMVDEEGCLVQVKREEILERLIEGWLLECDTLSLWNKDKAKYHQIDLREDRLDACDTIKDMLTKGWTVGKP